MNRNNLIFLPGFLGVEEDFSFLKLPGFFYPILPESSREVWVDKFIGAVDAISPPRALIAYSMGGRLALSALVKRPNLFDQVILISTHLGISDPNARAVRLQHDLKWANDFRTLPWNLLMKKWNGQESLASIEVRRKEGDYERESLARLLETYSLGRQPDFTKEKLSLDHIIGEKDQKLRPFEKIFRGQLVPSASHRVLWENPAFVKKTIFHILSANR